jgi:hypothetical protein
MRLKSPPEALVHYTKSDNSLLSIIQFGFLAAHNPTELLDTIAGGRVLPEKTICSGGIICFSELDGLHTKEFRNRDLRKVTNLNPNGYSINRLRRAFQKYAPSDLPTLTIEKSISKAGILNRADIMLATRSAMVSSGTSTALPASDPFARLISTLRYCQTNFHRWEKEWRLGSQVIQWTETKATSLSESRSARKKQELQILRQIYARSSLAGFINNTDQLLLSNLSFCPEPHLIRWVEVPSSKADSMRRELNNMRNVCGWPCNSIEVRPS